MIRNVWAKVTSVGNSAANWFVQQISYKGRTSNTAVVYPYGMHANAKPNESLALVIVVGGKAQNKAAFVYNPNIRPDLKEGEVAIYQPGSTTIIKLNANGNINIIAPTVNVTATNVNIDAKTTNIGVGGEPIARLGDLVTVPCTAHPSNTSVGTITSASPNNTST